MAHTDNLDVYRFGPNAHPGEANGRNDMDRYCAEMTQIAFIAYLVVGTFLDTAYFDLLYYLIGITIILKERLRVGAIEPNVLEAMTRTAVPVLAKRSRANVI